MIPVLQQMFAAPVQVGAGQGAADSGAPDMVAAGSDGFDIRPAEQGAEAGLAQAKPEGGFAAVFVAQHLVPKTDFATPEAAVLAERDVSAESLLEGGAIFALSPPPLPIAAAPTPKDASLAGVIGAEQKIDPVAGPVSDPITGIAAYSVPVAGLDQIIGPDQIIGLDHAGAPFGPALPEVLPDQGPRAEIVSQAAGSGRDDLPILSQALLAAQPLDAINAPATQIDDGLKAADLSRAPQLAPPTVVISDIGATADQQVAVLPQGASQPVAQILPIWSSAPMASLAEAMFQTQMDGVEMAIADPDVAMGPNLTGPNLTKPKTAFAILQGDLGLAKGDTFGGIAVLPAEISMQTPDDPDISLPPPTAPMTELAATEPDTAAGAAVAALPDLAQKLTQDMGADGQPLPAKTDVAPLQTTAQTLASAPMPNAPTLAPPLATQILPHANAAKTGPIEVLLNPAELGHLRFEIHQKGETVQVVLSAERPETLELLRRNGDQLASEFRNAGFLGASLSFGQWGQSSDGQPPASFLSNADDDFVPVVLPPLAKPPMAQDNSRNLNLRL